MWVLKWAVRSRSRHSLQTIDEAGPKESPQPQWGAAAARPEIRGLPHRSIQGPANSASDLEPLNRDRSLIGVGSCSYCPTFKDRGTLASLVNCTEIVNPSLPSVKKLRGSFEITKYITVPSLPLQHLRSSHNVGWRESHRTLPPTCPSTPQPASSRPWRDHPPLARGGAQRWGRTEQWYLDLLPVCQRVHLFHPQRLVTEEHRWTFDDGVQLCENLLVSTWWGYLALYDIYWLWKRLNSRNIDHLVKICQSYWHCLPWILFGFLLVFMLAEIS